MPDVEFVALDLPQESKRKQPGEGSRFVVDLGSVKLPEDVEQAVAMEIQNVVLKALAGLDIAKERSIPTKLSKWERIWGFWPPFPIDIFGLPEDPT